MPFIYLETFIDADQQTCFDASRSIDVHALSMALSDEKPVGGRTAGLIQLNESVTWRARHLGVWRHLTSRITEMDEPHNFTDEIVRGPFARMIHRHFFVANERHTVMKDEFYYVAPFGFLGKLADVLFLKKYMYRLLQKRNEFICAYCEEQQRLKGLR